MIESLKKSLEAHPDNPFMQGHVEALTAAEEKRNARRSAAACSRIGDPEGKHLEICRQQLASVVADRDKYKAAYEVAIYNLIGVAGYGHPGVKQATDIVDYSENSLIERPVGFGG